MPISRTAAPITIDGKAVRFQNPRQAMEKGIGMVFQEQSLIPNLTVMENIFLGYERSSSASASSTGRPWRRRRAQQLAKVKLDIDPGTITSRLSFAQRQLVELAKVLTLEERVRRRPRDPAGRADQRSGRGRGEDAVQHRARPDEARVLHLCQPPDGRGDGAVRPHLCDEGRGGGRRGAARAATVEADPAQDGRPQRRPRILPRATPEAL